MGIDGGIGFPSESGTLGIADRKHLRSALFGVANGHQRVHGLSGLTDCNNEGLLVNNWVAIAELMSKLNAGWNLCPLLNCVLGNLTGIGRGAAGDDGYAVDLTEPV